MRNALLIVIGLLFSGATYAAHGPSGCGLGAQIFADKSGLAFNVMAATTNGSSGNQTFGMSTGSLGCEDAGTASVAAVSFIENNMMALSNDVSKGEGQTLDAYLTLIDATSADKSVIRANFADIFAAGNSAQDIHNVIASII